MKLNYKRTIFVGFAFFLICTFWQAYDTTVPLILTNKFGLSQTASGVVMALDNILALFMLPLFGAISDRSHHRLGRRTPFILLGTIVAVVAFFGMSFADNLQLKRLSEVSAIDDPAALHTLYHAESAKKLKTPEGDEFVLADLFTEDEFAAIRCELIASGSNLPAKTRTGEVYELNDLLSKEEQAKISEYKAGKTFSNPHYTDYVVPARQAYANQLTAQNPGALILFMALLLIALIAMSTFRSPAVALMPDVTIKPLRSKANAVINLMGSAGGTLVLVLGMVFATGSVKNSMMSYIGYYGVIVAVMLIALAIFRWKVKEPKFVEDMQQTSREFGIEEKEEEQDGGRKLSKPERTSLVFLLASIVLWFMGYNAVTSKYSVYASNILHKDYNLTLIIAQAAAIIAYLPVGMVASKVGRKKTILAGIVMLVVAVGVAISLRASSPTILMNLMFMLAGVGWATINVNSFPMVVEMCRGGNVGKYTGIYYTASMAAQTLTPMLSGVIMDRFGMTTLFPYATIFVSLSFVTMLFVKHGDNKPTAQKGLEALNVED